MWQGTGAAVHLLGEMCRSLFSFGCKSLLSKIFSCAVSQSLQAVIVLTFPHVMVGRPIINKMIVLASSSASCKRVSLASIYYACIQHCGLLQVLQN